MNEDTVFTWIVVVLVILVVAFFAVIGNTGAFDQCEEKSILFDTDYSKRFLGECYLIVNDLPITVYDYESYLITQKLLEKDNE